MKSQRKSASTPRLLLIGRLLNSKVRLPSGDTSSGQADMTCSCTDMLRHARWHMRAHVSHGWLATFYLLARHSWVGNCGFVSVVTLPRLINMCQPRVGTCLRLVGTCRCILSHCRSSARFSFGLRLNRFWLDRYVCCPARFSARFGSVLGFVHCSVRFGSVRLCVRIGSFRFGSVSFGFRFGSVSFGSFGMSGSGLSIRSVRWMSGLGLSRRSARGMSGL